MILRSPTLGEIPELDRLCLRSKASWGYDDDFLARCAPVLQIRHELLARGHVRLADIDGAIAGVVQLEVLASDANLDLLFVDPPWFRRGVGAALFRWAESAAVRAGASSMLILSDPGARPFYEAMGARFVRMAPSDAISGRELPLLQRSWA